MTLLVLPLLLAILAQDTAPAAGCPALRAGLQRTIEANYAGHLLEVKGQRTTDHQKLLATLRRPPVGTEGEGCRVVLQRLVDWYDDPHLFLYQSTRRDSAVTVARGTLHREGTLLRLSPGMWGKAAPQPASARWLLDPNDVHRPTIQVRDDVVIVAVPSHNPRVRPMLDSLVHANDAVLRSDKPLIADQRGNEGGGSQATAFLMPFLMDSTPRPRRYDFGRAMMLSSPDQVRYASRSFGADTPPFVKRLVAELQAHPGELVPLVDPTEPPDPGSEVVAIDWRGVGDPYATALGILAERARGPGQ